MKLGDIVRRLIEDDALFYGLLIVMVAIASFGLGRWSVALPVASVSLLSASVSQASSSNTESHAALSSSTQTTIIQSAQQHYVASKNGTKYHLLTCPGAQEIKDENKIYFATKQDAEAAGYTPASNCKGI